MNRWALAAAIASVTVFGLSIGQGGPLLPLLLEERGIGAAVNGLNAGSAFIGVLIGPLLAPRFVRLWGVRKLLLVTLVLDIAVTLSLKLFDSLGAWFVLRVLLGVVGSTIFTTGEAWINHLAGSVGRGRVLGIYAAALSAGFGIGPLVLSLTGIHGWAPFVVNGAITALAIVPLLGVGEASEGFGRQRGVNPLVMFGRAPAIMAAVVVFGLYESALMSLLPIWGVRAGMSERLAATTLTAVYAGSILLQVAIGWLSDRVSRVLALGMCSVVGVAGALVMALDLPTVALFVLLFVWGGVASGIYPVALSMAGDRFRASDLVAANAAMIIAYGLGGLTGPALGGLAMELRQAQGLPFMFALLFGMLLVIAVGRRWRVTLR